MHHTGFQSAPAAGIPVAGVSERFGHLNIDAVEAFHNILEAVKMNHHVVIGRDAKVGLKNLFEQVPSAQAPGGINTVGPEARD